MEEKHQKLHKTNKKHKKRKKSSSNSSNSSSDEWVEKETSQNQKTREDWMAMTGLLKTYTKDDIHSKREDKDKRHIDSYNPSTSSRELNPYWKHGGSGLPQTVGSFRQSNQFLKPKDDDNYYKSNNKSDDKLRHLHKHSDSDNYYKKSCRNRKSEREQKPTQLLKYSDEDNYNRKSSNSIIEKQIQISHEKKYNWRKSESGCQQIPGSSRSDQTQDNPNLDEATITDKLPKEKSEQNSKYLSDEKMNKLAAKIVKAEIMGDTKLITELKGKLEAAREYRKQNPDVKSDEKDDGIMLISTNSLGNSRPLVNTSKDDARSKGGKRRADTHVSRERTKYFGNDDKYNLAQMFQNEKYGNNYNDEAELARISSKSKNPNDDLEDIFMDEISKSQNEAKDSEAEKNRAIQQHVRMEKSLDGCEYCVDSKNMLKHLIISCGTKVYIAVPSRKSLVNGHCFISTIQHSTCVTALDEDVWEEIMDFRKALTKFFNSQNKDVVFFETASKLHRFPHLVISCVPLPRDVGDMAAIYFKKALLESETEWSMNKKVVELKGKNIRKCVPKGLPYFWIDFGMDPGFAHVIEDQQLFSKTFGEEIIAGILDLEHSHWKNPKKDSRDVQRKKAFDFLTEWKPFDPVKDKHS